MDVGGSSSCATTHWLIQSGVFVEDLGPRDSSSSLMMVKSSGFPPNLLTGTAHTYTVHKANTDACSFTGGRLVCRGSMIHFSMIVSMVFLKCA